MAKDSNINPKDTKDLANSLSAAAQEMQKMASYADSFSKNICGAVDCLAKITNSQKESKKHSNDIVDSTKDQSAALTDVAKKIEESNKALTKQSKIGKFINEGLKNTLSASLTTLGVLGNMVGSSGFGGMMNSIKDIGGALVSGGLILGPVAVFQKFVSFIFDKFLEMDAAVEDVAKGIGRGGAKAREFAASSFDISRNFASYGISLKDASEAAVSLAGEFSNLDYLTKGNQTTVALMSKQLGIGSAEAAKSLGTFMNMRGGSLETAKSTARFAMSMAKAANLPLPAIMQDLSQNSESAAKFGGKFTQSTIIASAMAKKMGISFGDIAKIAEGILDIESSVEKQFEAQVLLGREVNLEKARYYALTGDTKKLTGEVLKQVGSQAQFEKMMPMQRQALADAIGVGVEQLGKMVSRQKEGLSVEEKTLALQEKAFDTQLKESGKMVGVVTQIEGALTELGYAIMKFFGINVSAMYKDGAKMGENFANMIHELSVKLGQGEGPLFDFLTGVKNITNAMVSAIKFIIKYKDVFIGLGIVYAGFKAYLFISQMITSLGVVAQTAGVKTAAGSSGITIFFSALATGLSLLANGPALIGLAAITVALYVLSPLLETLATIIGNVLIKALDTIGKILPPIVGSLKDLILGVMDKLTLEKALAIYAMGPALMSLALGLAALAGGGLAVGFASLFRSNPADKISEIIKAFSGMNAETLKSMEVLGNLMAAFSRTNPSLIKQSLEALSTGITGINNISIGNVKSSVQSGNKQQDYYSESLKYLKIIALSTTILAEKTGKNVSLRTLDRDLAILD